MGADCDLSGISAGKGQFTSGEDDTFAQVPASVISQVTPASVVGREMFGDVAEELMFPAEAQAVERAVPKRRREFGTVRFCARQALAELGVPAAPLLSGDNREPLWPPGIVGSLTHCAGYRAAVVAHSRDVVGVGIDAEPHAPLPDGVLESIGFGAELDQLAAFDGVVHADRLLFCAKEAVYKVWFPLARCWLGFADAAVTLGPNGGFEVELLVPGPTVNGAELTTLSGRWLVERDIIVTAISLSAPKPT